MPSEMTVQFLGYGLLLTGGLYFAQTMFRAVKQGNFRRSALFGIALIIVVAALLAWTSGVRRVPDTLGSNDWLQQSPTSELLLFGTMLVGMVASYFTKQIEQRRTRIEEKRRTGDVSPTSLEFDFWEFSYPMLVSVITFGAILESVGGKPVMLSSVILSFQTGFFWQTVLARSTPK
jgi:small-conductance mechanosensitive channel